MKRFFIIVISTAVLAIAGYGIAYLVMPMHSVELREYTHEVSVTCDDAYIVREETVYYAAAAGTVYNAAAEGERVASGAVISSTFGGNTSEENLRRLRTIDAKLKRLRTESSDSALYSVDAASVESEISDKMNETAELARENNVEKIHENKEDINNMRSGTAEAGDRTAALEAEREAVLAAIPGTRTDTVSDRAGIFTSYIDGLEAVLMPERVEDYTPTYIRSLGDGEASRANGRAAMVGDPICKVMNNHDWYVLGTVGAESADVCTEGETVSIRFPELSDNDTDGEITYVGEPDENGDRLFLVKATTYTENAFSYRRLKADIIFEEYSGYRVPIDAIHTGGGINLYYVNAMKGSETYKCDCEVLYTDMAEGYSIIKSTDSADNKLSAMERLVTGER